MKELILQLTARQQAEKTKELHIFLISWAAYMHSHHLCLYKVVKTWICIGQLWRCLTGLNILVFSFLVSLNCQPVLLLSSFLSKLICKVVLLLTAYLGSALSSSCVVLAYPS